MITTDGIKIETKARQLANGYWSAIATWEGGTGITIRSRQYATTQESAVEQAREDVLPLARLAFQREADRMRDVAERIGRLLSGEFEP